MEEPQVSTPYRRARNDIAEQSRLNRIAKTQTPNAKPPVDGITSSAELLAARLTNLFEHGRQIAGAFRIDEQAVWEEMLARSRGQRR